MNLARQHIIATIDIINGKMVRKDPKETYGFHPNKIIGAMTAALVVATRVGEAQVQAISYRDKLSISVLLSNNHLQSLCESPLDFSDMCVLVGNFAEIPIYFWSGAGWSVCVQNDLLHVQSGATPPPWICSEDQLEN